MSGPPPLSALRAGVDRKRSWETSGSVMSGRRESMETVTEAFALTYSPAPGADDAVAGQDDLARLVDVAAGIRTMAGDRPLYADVRLVDGMVRFVVELDPFPDYGAAHVARGLVTRAASEAGTPGQLVEISCETVGT